MLNNNMTIYDEFYYILKHLDTYMYTKLDLIDFLGTLYLMNLYIFGMNNESRFDIPDICKSHKIHIINVSNIYLV